MSVTGENSTSGAGQTRRRRREGRDSRHRPQEERHNLLISRVLAIGLALAVVLLLVGVVLAGIRTGVPVPRKTSIPDIPRAIVSGEPGGFFDLGLLVLLATPAARVAALFVSFTRSKLWLFSAISLVVLAVLALSAFLGLQGG